jgi:hypothetical protein
VACYLKGMEIITDVTRKQDADTFTECDAATLAAQIGMGNLMAISGRRVIVRETGVDLPVSNGYTVTVDLAGDDTYTVRRVFTRRTRGELLPTTWIKGELTGVYCDQVGEQAYQASCFRSNPFGDTIRHDPFA